MRELAFCEVNAISGGINCFDADLMAKVKAKVIRDGLIVSTITTVFGVGVVFGASQSYLITGLSAVIIAPYAAALGAYTSSAWSNPVA